MSQRRSVESGMTFLYDPNDVFLPEQSSTYQFLAKRNGIKACDFVWCYHRKLLFIEVKTTAPEQHHDLTSYLEDIHLKLIHSLLLYLGIITGRSFREAAILPESFSSIEIGQVSIVPVLIVRRHRKDWLPSLADSIRKKMRGTTKAYCLDDVIVLNEERARKKGFIL